MGIIEYFRISSKIYLKYNDFINNFAAFVVHNTFHTIKDVRLMRLLFLSGSGSGLKEAYHPYVRGSLALGNASTTCLREITNHLRGLETPEMDRYHLVEFPMNRWLDRNQLRASGGPSQSALIVPRSPRSSKYEAALKK